MVYPARLCDRDRGDAVAPGAGTAGAGPRRGAEPETRAGSATAVRLHPPDDRRARGGTGATGPAATDRPCGNPVHRRPECVYLRENRSEYDAWHGGRRTFSPASAIE